MPDTEVSATTNENVRGRTRRYSEVIRSGVFRLGLTIGVLTGVTLTGVGAVSTAAVFRSYGIELDDHRFGIETSKKIKKTDLKQIAALRLEDLAEQTGQEHSLRNKADQFYLEINRLAEKTIDRLHGRVVPAKELRYQPKRVDLWNQYKQANTVPLNVSTFNTTSASADGLVIETSFSFIRTMHGRVISGTHTETFLPISTNPNYRELFNKIRNSEAVEGDTLKEQKRFEELEAVIDQVRGGSKTKWEWETGYIGRPKANYLTLGVIGKYTEGNIEYRYSLNSLGDLEIHKERKMDPITRAINFINNTAQTPMALVFRRI